MPYTWSIRSKLFFGAASVLAMVVMLSVVSFYVHYSYRHLVLVSNSKLEEVAHATDLRTEAFELLEAASQAADWDNGEAIPSGALRNNVGRLVTKFETYRTQLERNAAEGITTPDHELLQNLGAQVARIAAEVNRGIREPGAFDPIQQHARAEALARLVANLPIKAVGELDDIIDSSRVYRVNFYLAAFSSLLALGLTINLVWLFYRWVFRPIRILHRGSRRVARGNFGYRIHLETNDEMAELAAALNEMTSRFQTIYEDLDQQVRDRSRQLIRSEQLASVGFLAAGVAHEINNPLASIAMCSESLEARLGPYLAEQNGDGQVVRDYLRMIQQEAFRCKSITEKLLDFSRLGDLERHETELTQLVEAVVDMIGHLGKYRGKHIDFAPQKAVWADVNPEQIKQVVLNLVVNALDSMEADQHLRIEVGYHGAWVELRFVDEGCGMTPDVLENIFEPFFTRRREGQGTGLGLSISHRIVNQHGGEIEATSPGQGQGSTFVVRLPRMRSKYGKEPVREHANA